MLYVIFAPTGEMFEVPPFKLRELVELGWTFWHPSEEHDVFTDENLDDKEMK